MERLFLTIALAIIFDFFRKCSKVLFITALILFAVAIASYFTGFEGLSKASALIGIPMIFVVVMNDLFTLLFLRR